MIQALSPKHTYFDCIRGRNELNQGILTLDDSTNWIMKNRIEVSQECCGDVLNTEILFLTT
jgi:hypothetical protein